MIALPIGKAKLRIQVEGCRDCGTQFAPSWHVVQVVAVMFRRHEYKFDVHVCGDCFKKGKR